MFYNEDNYLLFVPCVRVMLQSIPLYAVLTSRELKKLHVVEYMSHAGKSK